MKIVWVFSMALVLGACSSSNQPSPTNGQSASTSAAAPTQSPPSRGDDAAWQLGYKDDPMDGNLVRAMRTYSFPDIDTSVQVDFVCTVAKKRLQINVTSVVGNSEKPSNASLFQKGSTGVDGRIKFSEFSPQPLLAYFKLGQNFGNVITYELRAGKGIPNYPFLYKAHGTYIAAFDQIEFSTPVVFNYLKTIGVNSKSIDKTLDADSTRLLEAFPSQYENVAQITTDPGTEKIYANEIAALSGQFPIAIEAVNGRGKFDLVVAKSGPIGKVLEQCGGSGPVLDPAVLQFLRSPGASSPGSSSASSISPASPASTQTPSSTVEQSASSVMGTGAICEEGSNGIPALGAAYQGGVYICREHVEGGFWNDWYASRSKPQQLHVESDGKTSGFEGDLTINCSAGTYSWADATEFSEPLASDKDIAGVVPRQVVTDAIHYVCKG